MTGPRYPSAMAVAKPAKSARSALLMVGAALFLVSWVMPVFEGQQWFGAIGDLSQVFNAKIIGPVAGPKWLPGWEAFRLAWGMLTEQRSPEDGDWQHVALGAACLTNLAMLATLLVLACGARPRVLGLLLLACAALDSAWTWLPEEQIRDALRSGYYVWAGSFLLTGVALRLPWRRPVAQAA